MKLFSVDAEVDGLYGESIAIAVTVRVDGQQVDSFVGRVPEARVRNSWVRENVSPALRPIPVSHQFSDRLEEAFWEFWMKHREDSIVVAHCGSPVESGLFRRCVERDLPSRQWQGPFPCIHDVGTLLLLNGKDASSVDKFLSENGLSVQVGSGPHDPQYDALAAAVVWEHLAA